MSPVPTVADTPTLGGTVTWDSSGFIGESSVNGRAVTNGVGFGFCSLVDSKAMVLGGDSSRVSMPKSSS